MAEISADPIRPFGAALSALPTARADSPLRLRERAPQSVAVILAGRGREAVAAFGLGAAIGVPVRGGSFCSGDSSCAIGTGPGTWLLVRDEAGAETDEVLRACLAGAARIADQSGAYGFLEVDGPMARRLLACGLSIDLHPEAFPPGAAAASVIAHINVLVWRAPAGDAFTVAVGRSLAAGFWDWLAAAAAGLGLAPARLTAGRALDSPAAQEARPAS